MSYDNLEKMTYETILAVQKMGQMPLVLPPFPYLNVPDGAFDLTWELMRLRVYQSHLAPLSRLENPKNAPFVDEVEPDITPNEIRFRLEEPDHFKKKTFRYKYLPGTEGIAIVAAKRKKRYKSPTRRKPDPMVAQSLRFDRSLWTVPEAIDWAVSHQFLRPAQEREEPLGVASFARAANPATFEAPPAMLRDIWAWVSGVYASNVLFQVNSDIKEAQNRIEWIEDGISKNRRVLEEVDQVLEENKKVGKDIIFNLFSISRGTWKFVWEYPKEEWRKPMMLSLLSLKNVGLFNPVYTIDSGKRSKTKEGDNYRSEEAAKEVKKRIRQNISALEKAVETVKRLGVNRGDYFDESLVTMYLIKRECLKYTDEAKNYQHQIVRKEFPVDLTGWRYGEKEVETAFRSIFVELDFLNKSKDSFGGIWLRGKRTIRLVRVLGSGIGSFGSVEAFQETMVDIKKTLRHELQHVGQDLLQVKIMEETGKEDPLLPGISPRKTWEPGQPLSWVTHLPESPGGEQKEHYFREEEFQTRIADDLYRFKRKLRSVPKYLWKDVFKVWVGLSVKMDTETKKLPQSDFFLALKDKEPRKWRKAVKTLSGILSQEGLL